MDTIGDVLLKAALELEESGAVKYTYGRLCVVAWQMNTPLLGLVGHEEDYPDTHKISSALMGKKGLVGTGHLQRLGAGLYSLTEAGRDRARSDRPPPGKKTIYKKPKLAPTPPKKLTVVPLSRDQDALLKRLYASEAWRKQKIGAWDTVNFTDGGVFWGLTDDKCAFMDRTLGQLEVALDDLKGLLEGRRCKLSDGREVEQADVVKFIDLSDKMASKFCRHLTLLRMRNERQVGEKVKEVG